MYKWLLDVVNKKTKHIQLLKRIGFFYMLERQVESEHVILKFRCYLIEVQCETL